MTKAGPCLLQPLPGTLNTPSPRVFDQAAILLVEDSENDVLLIQRACRAAGIVNPMRVVTDGDQAVSYLQGAGLYANRVEHPWPDIVLLDLNLPHKDGFEVLSWIRSQPALRRILVIMLTASARAADADMAFDHGANFYLVKPGRYGDLVEMIRRMYQWLRLNQFPSMENSEPRKDS